MGTPDFAVPSLKALNKYDCDISLIITQPDRPSKRGRKLTPSPVKITAQNLGFNNIIQPQTINDPEIIKKIKALNPDLFVVVAFGHKLFREILSIPCIYPINIHASLLPSYRGSSPIQAAILNMDKETGVTTIIMDENLDTGDILLSSRTYLSSHENYQDLHDRLSQMGADLIIKTLDGISKNQIKPRKQGQKNASFAPMLRKNHGKINWNIDSEKINSHVRAMTPWPGAFTYLNEKNIKIFKTKYKKDKTGFKPGTIFLCNKQGIHVAAGVGSVVILELQEASKKRLLSHEFLRGKKIEIGTIFDDYK